MPAHSLNLRHLRAFREIAAHESISRAAEQVHLSQPAITQALSKLERLLGASLFDRTRRGMFLNAPGGIFLFRVKRALDLVQEGARMAHRAGSRNQNRGFRRFDQLVTSGQLRALIAVVQAGNFSLAARSINISQPSLHRAARDLEKLSGVPLFKRVNLGIELTPPARALARHARLAFAELEQGIDEVKGWQGLDCGRIVIGSMPLARAEILPRAINAFLDLRPTVEIRVIDGPYDDLLHGLRHGEIDLLTGALRYPLPINDVKQEPLLSDPLAIVARAGHPLAGKHGVQLADLAEYGWAVPRAGTPTRAYFDTLFAKAAPCHVVEASSLVLVRGLLAGSNRLAILSAHQMHHVEQLGLLCRLDFDMSGTHRDIGITLRKNWQPTATQSLFIALLRDAGKAFQAAPI